jgi:glycosyltransferase involved in cell wall biosynthesis
MTTYKDDIGVLRRAIDSILTQTMDDLECIVVFQSADENYEVLLRLSNDPRIATVRALDCAGKTACFNFGLRLARGRYIARMDSDDFAYPDRLAKQLAFLEANSDISVVGGAGRLLNESGEIVGVRQFPSSHDGILRSLIVTNPVCHPSVLWDRERVGRDRFYDENFLVEDLEMWMRLIDEGHRIANLPEVVIDYTQPHRYQRPLRNWRGNLRVRLHHWRLCLRYPPMLLGIFVFGVLSVLPQRVVDWLVGRNPLSDRLRSVRNVGSS